jgi:hypothetical protein
MGVRIPPGLLELKKQCVVPCSKQIAQATKENASVLTIFAG